MDIDSADAGGVLGNPSKAVQSANHQNGSGSANEHVKGFPDGFEFVLPFLDLRSRMTVERVCKSLREAVKDPLVWQHLQVERPASRNLTDDKLYSLVRRADGLLKSLSISNSLRTTDVALAYVLDLNPGLVKLAIPGCTGISPESFVALVEAHSLRARARGLPGIKQVQIRGLYEITEGHLDRLRHVVDPLGREEDQDSVPLYYGSGAGELNRHDVRPIDVGVCPLCASIRVVYDCAEHWTCSKEQSCQACSFCIPRCEECGCCIRDIPYAETLCADLTCARCWFDLPKCLECNRAVCSQHAPEFTKGDARSFTCENCLSLRELPQP